MKNYSPFALKKLVFLFFIFSTFLSFGQGTSCATAETLVIDGACDTATSLTQTINTAVCGVTNWRRIGYYTFTVSSGPQNITITADSGNRNLVLGLFSGTCGTPINIQCMDANTINGAQTETITTNLANGTYIIAVGNTTNNNMTLNSICVTSGPSTNFTCGTATPLPCGTTALAGTTVGSPGTPAHGTGCSMSNYGAWYTFVGDGQQTTISTNPSFDIKLSVATGSCGALTNIVCTDTAPETATFTTTNGVTYYVYVAHWLSGSTTTGTFTISRTCTPAPTPPSNDLCANATPLPCGTTNLAGTTVNTSNTAHGTGCTMSNYGVWYTFVGDGQQTTITTNPAFDIKLSVATGSCGSLTNIACTDASPETATFITTIGVTYYVYVAHWLSGSSTTGTFTISRTCVPVVSPPNDNCSGATALTVNPDLNCGTVTSGTINFATDSGVTGSGCGGTDDDDVWYSFVATSTVHHIELLNVSGSVTDMYHAVYGGTCGTLGAAIICSDPNSSIVSGLTIGNTYYIQVYSFTSTGGQNTTFDICVGTPPPPPANDNCSGAIALTVNPSIFCTATTAGTIASATDSGIIGSGCGGTDNDDVWYSFVATNTTHYVSLLNVAGSTTDLYHAVYSGASGCGALGAAIICSDPNNSTLTGLTIGQTYYVQVYSWGSTSGQTSTFDICISSPAPIPTNDNCSGAISLTVNPDLSCGSVTAGTVASATDSGITGSGCGGTDDDDVWYSFVATNTTHHISLLNVSGSTTDMYHAVYSGASGCGSLGAALVCSDDDNSIVTGLTVGQTYYVQVYTWTSTTGQTSTFNICVGTPCNGNGPGTGTTTLGCPSVISGGLGLNGADPNPFDCLAASTCVDLEATYLDLGDTSTYTVESIPYAPPYQFSCLANAVSVNTDDVWSPAISLPFDFCFFGNTYNQCTIGSNGVLSFDMANAGTGSGYSFSNNLPSTVGALFENTIYGVYHDIDPGAGGEVGWELITLNTGCQALVASWSNVPMFSDNSILYTGMMVLYENTNVIEVYIQEKNIDNNNVAPWNDGNAIVGIQNATGTAAVVAPGRNGLDANWTATNEAWRFVPAGTSITSLAWYEGSGTSGPIIGTTDVINVCPAVTTTYTAEITYTLCDGSTLIETEETTVTVNGSKVWNGSISTDWNVANNWTPTGIPTASDCVVIPDTANDPIVSGTNYNGLGLNLTIQNNAILNVTSNNAVTITDWVNINAGGDLQLNDSASLIQINNNANTGTMHMDRTASIRQLDYVYWSSPVTSFASNQISTGTNPGLIYKWEPTIPNGTYASDFGNWVSGNETMSIGRGYIVRGPSTFTTTPQNFTATFTGTPNNGVISTPIQRSTYIGAPYVGPTSTMVTLNDDNWNLVGNPYPSALNADTFLATNAATINGFVKIWTHGTLPSNMTVDPFYQDYQSNYTVADYITYNSLGSTPPGYNGMIGAGQGFFVLMNDLGSTNENIIFNNTMRSATFDNSQFYRTTNSNENSNSVEKHRIWLELVNPAGTNTKTLVGYANGASQLLDNAFDAPALGVKATFEIYSVAENKELLIQGRSLPFDENDQIPLGVTAPTNGIYTIALSLVDGLFLQSNQNIYLEDLLLNTIHDLKAAPYHFTIDAGTTSDRFVLRYTNETLGNEDFINENDVFVVSQNQLSVISLQEHIQSVLVFDVLGRLLIHKKDQNQLEIPLQEIQKNNAPLVIQIILQNGKRINKKVVY